MQFLHRNHRLMLHFVYIGGLRQRTPNPPYVFLVDFRENAGIVKAFLQNDNQLNCLVYKTPLDL